MKNIILPYNFSHEANQALNFTIKLCETSSSRLCVYHAYEPEKKLEIDNAIQSLIKMIKHKSSLNFEIITEELNHGDTIHSKIVKLSILKEADLIISGTQGIDEMKEYRLETNSSQLIPEAQCPVLSLKSDNEVSFERILISSEFLDLDDYSEFSIVKELINLFKSRVTFVFVNQEEVNKIHESKIIEFAKKWDIKDYGIEIVSNTTTASGIYEAIKKVDPDLLVMGYHKSRKEDHELFGSLTSDFINFTKYSILAIHL